MQIKTLKVKTRIKIKYNENLRGKQGQKSKFLTIAEVSDKLSEFSVLSVDISNVPPREN